MTGSGIRQAGHLEPTQNIKTAPWFEDWLAQKQVLFTLSTCHLRNVTLPSSKTKMAGVILDKVAKVIKTGSASPYRLTASLMVDLSHHPRQRGAIIPADPDRDRSSLPGSRMMAEDSTTETASHFSLFRQISLRDHVTSSGYLLCPATSYSLNDVGFVV